MQDELPHIEATVGAVFIGRREVYISEAAHLQRWEVALCRASTLQVLVMFMSLCCQGLLHLIWGNRGSLRFRVVGWSCGWGGILAGFEFRHALLELVNTTQEGFDNVRLIRVSRLRSCGSSCQQQNKHNRNPARGIHGRLDCKQQANT